MIRKQDRLRTRFGPLLQKTLEHALSHAIGEEFPRIGGPRIRQLCAQMILEVVHAHIRSRDHVRHGQVLWMGISKDDPPHSRRRLADMDLIPLVLDLVTGEDIQARLDRKPAPQRLQTRALRLCQQAYAQGGLLSNCDLAELLGTDDGSISRVLTEQERQTHRLVPRRATLHDVGTGLTHKRIICWKRYAEGKSAEIVAKETYHSLEAVDRYLGQFDRVRHCRREGLSPERTAYTLNCGIALVNEYLAIDRELEERKP